MSSPPNPDPFKPQLVMRRPSLDGLPPLSLPQGYALQSLGPGGDAAWEKIIGASFAWPATAGKFGQIMRSDPAFRPDRVLFICRGDEPVATASAWHRASQGDKVGYLHYVGTLPSETGRGLGLQVSLACLHKMVLEGRASAVLQTDDFRLPAVHTYLKLGFGPLLVHENQRQRWREVFKNINRLELIEKFDAELAGPVVGA